MDGHWFANSEVDARGCEHAAPDPASQLDAMVRADFDPGLWTPSTLSAWCAFWGETQSRPLFQQICGAKNEPYNHTLEAI